MSDATHRLIEQLRQRLRATRRRLHLSQISRGGVITLGVSAAAVLCALLLEAYFWLPATGRIFLLSTVAAAIAGPLLVLVGTPLAELLGLSNHLSEEKLARDIGNRFDAVGDRLINLLHLADGRGSISDEELREEAIQNLGADVREVPFEELATFDSTRRALPWAIIPVAGLLLLAATLPGTVSQAGQRLLAPGTSFDRPVPFAWTVNPGDSTLVKGDTLTISATAEGNNLPGTAVLEVQREDETHVEEIEMRADSSQTFRHQRSAVNRPLRYRVTSDPVSSRWYSVDIVNRPLVRELQISLTPPSYTGLPQRTLAPNIGDISALPGTRADVTVSSDSSQLADAYIAFESSDTTALTVDGSHARGSFTIREASSYHVEVRNPRGISNDDPIRYRIQTLTDEPPSIELQAPPAVSDIGRNGQKTLQMRMTDDYGFTRLRLYYRLSESQFDEPMLDFESIDLPLEAPDRLDQAVEYTWRIAENTELDPVRGDAIEYYVQVWDNNSVAGYQTAKTATQLVRFPSLDQQYEDLDRDQETVASSLEALQEEAQAMEKEFQSLRDEVRRQQNTDWDNQQTLRRLQERQQVMEKRAEEITRQVESMTREMENENLVSEETLQMYEELQNVAQEIDSSELREALQKLQEAMENMDLQSTQQALQNFEFNEEEYQQRLERTLNLFEKLRTRQQLDEVARRTSELAERERRLAEQTEQLARQFEGDTTEATDPASDESPDSTDDSDEDNVSPESSAISEDAAEGDSSAVNRRGSDSSSDPSQSQTTEESASDNRQASSADSSSAPSPGERLADQQEQTREEMEAVEDRMDQLREQMEKTQQSPRQEFEQMQEQMRQQELPQQMQENSQQLREQQFDQARKGQQSMQQQLEKLSEQMSQMQQSMQSQQLQVNIAGIRQALEDVLHLSTVQEDLRRRVSTVAEDSPVLGEVSQHQVSLSEGLSTVNDSLQSLAGEIPRMSQRIQQRSGEALRAMSQSIESINQRNLSQTTTHQRVSMEHLNNLAVDLSRLLEQLQNMQQQGGSGDMSMQQMMQQMQQMAGQQEKVNEQIQQLLNDIQGNRLSRGQQERLEQIRRQQQQIRRQLEEMQRNSGSGNDLLGDLEKVAEQMEESIRELRERSVSREMVDRQQQILSRLLQAQQSLQTQGREEQRTSETGRETNRQSPEPLAPAEDGEQLRQDLLRALESGYAPDYEELIKRYFEVLRERDEQ
jgi:hypothetical protein